MKEEMMNDAIDDVMEDGDEEEESDRIVNEVLDEIGIGLNQSLVDAPNSKLGAKTETVQEDDLQARLNSLRQ
ncbi:hypothetical protein BASA81_018526 [Batrachochytrium salamandrivorans]|nr:hypothetical protein BASA81_018526 [Batrachochytrium salamandrivorans]